MPEEKSEMQKFLGDIPVLEEQKAGEIFDKPVEDIVEEVEVKPEPRKNREHRRLESRYQAEREANIGLAAKLEALTEAQKFAQALQTNDVDESLLRLYGDDEKGKLAAKITQDLLTKTKTEAREEAMALFRQEQEDDAKEVRAQQEVLDGMLENIEDEFNVDLTSDSAAAKKARTGFFATLEKMSPKNREGIVTDYADPLATWEVYQSQNKPDTNRAKDLGSRSMVKSGASGDHKLEETAQERFLKDAGII